MICMFLAVTFVTLILTCSIFTINDLRLFKSNMVRNLKVLAEAVGKSNQAALRFEDKDAALQILSSVEAEPQVYYAALYTQSNELLVEFNPLNLEAKIPGKGENRNGLLEFFEEDIEIRSPILLKSKKIGEIVIRAKLVEYKKLLKTYSLLALFIFLTVMLLSLLFSIKLQSVISNPILNLAETTKRLSKNHDFSIRVAHNTRDEIGTLYLGFNEMLTRIENRGKELENYKNQLEEKVKLRTKELLDANLKLSNANKNLNKEIVERESVQENLERSLKDKDILLGEIHHRVKNNLQIISSMLRLQSNHTSNVNLIEVFKECSQRIESMALLYEKIFDFHNLSEIGLEEYFNDLVSRLLLAYGIRSEQISVRIETNSLLLGIDKIVPCSLILQELISNAIKHAFPGNRKGDIDVSLKLMAPESNMVEFKVCDNGVGLSEDWDFDKTQTLGLRLVKKISEEQLQGQIFVSKKGQTCFTIEFPIKEDKHDTRRTQNFYS